MSTTPHLRRQAIDQPAEFRRRLGQWYRSHARDLPWRKTADPYAIWLSEIMLQQTQVATVIDYYYRFLARFPNVAALAEAAEPEVLQMWAGLGYYRRARQLHAAAKRIAAAGRFPDSLDEILQLPGVGRYTAGAITSFAFDQPAPIVEANTQRLYSRLLKLECDPRSTDGQNRLWQFAEAILPAKTGSGSGKLNQALIELGSQICTPRLPACHQCPVREYCAAHAAGAEERIPVVAPKAKVTELIHVAVVLHRKGKVLLELGQPGQWWQGLWEFPRLDVTHLGPATKWDCMDQSICGQLTSEIQQRYDLYASPKIVVGKFTHAITRYRVRLAIIEFGMEPGNRRLTAAGLAWQPLARLDELPMSSPAARVRQMLQRAR